MSTPQMDRLRNIAALIASPEAPECPFLCMTGAGTPALPLQLILLLRHADIADETPFGDARAQTTEVAHVLHSALSRVRTGETRSVIRLTEVLRAAQPVAAQTGTYYSAMIAVLIDDRLVAAGIGRANLSVQRSDRLDELILPTTLNPTPAAEEGGVLRAALGIGFDEREVHSCDTNLDTCDFAILMIEPTHPRQFPFGHMAWSPQSPNDLLDNLRSQQHAGVYLGFLVGRAS